MYHAHFGLERGLFGEGIAADANVFRTPKHDRLIAHFKLALASSSSCMVLHGPAGVGKTTLTSAALRASSTRLALAWLGGMATNSAELLELVLVELGINTVRTSRIERLQLWRQFLGEMRATDSRLFVVAERTEDLSQEVLHALDQLTAPDAAGNSGANLVLLGHASIDEHLAAPLLDSLRQRVRFRAELEPFTEAELQDYLRHQVACAGGHFDRLFAPGTVAALYRYSRGVARLANTLCESSLDIAAVQQHKQLTAELVAKTAVSLLGLAEPTPAVQLAPAALPRVEPAAAPERRAAPRAATVATPIPAAQAAAAPAAVERAPEKPIVVERGPERPIVVERGPERAVVADRAPERPVVASAPAPAPVVAAAPPPVAAAPRAAAPTVAITGGAAPPPPPAELEFDGSATDVADVAVADFPVLTDAVELPAAPAAAPLPAPRQAAPAAPPRPAAPAPAKAPPAAAFAPPPAPAPKPATRAEAPQPAARPAPAPMPAPAQAKAAPPPAARAPVTKPEAPALEPPPAQDSDSDDVLRQTQTMRAIAGAKSLDEISEADAETLFGDAALDLVSAALASAAEWPDDDEPFTKPAPSPAPARAETPKATAKPEAKPAPPDDPFDLFGLGDDAPLELMDDATLPPANPPRRTALR